MSRSILGVSVLLFICGAGGMQISLLYLWSANLIDVIAGASGFVAGAVMLGTGIVSIAILIRVPALIDDTVSELAVPETPAPTQDIARWHTHFRKI